MQNELWRQPAMQVSEAVLLPALERRAAPRFGSRYLPPAAAEDVFKPADEDWGVPPSLALSTYVRPRGSMAGRSVLRAAGVQTGPVWMRARRTSLRRYCR